MSSSIVIDRERREAVVVLGNSTTSVDDTAFRLIGAPESSGGSGWSALLDPPTLIGALAAAVLPPFAGAMFLAAVRGGWGRRRSGRVRRSGVVGAAGSALLVFVAAFGFGTVSWSYAPFWLLGCALAGAGAGTAVSAWPRLDPDRGAGSGRRWAGAVTSLVLGIGLAVGVSGVFG